MNSMDHAHGYHDSLSTLVIRVSRSGLSKEVTIEEPSRFPRHDGCIPTHPFCPLTFLPMHAARLIFEIIWTRSKLFAIFSGGYVDGDYYSSRS